MHKTLRSAALATLLPGLALAAAGHTSFASYLRQVPGVPASAQAAHAAVTVRRDAYGQLELVKPAKLLSLEQALEAEAQLAASNPAATPAGVPNAANAQQFAQQVQNMTPAQQMAFAQQMAAQMNAGMQSGPLGPDDQAVVTLLDRRQQSSMARIGASQKLQQDLSLATRDWEAQHVRIEAEFSAALDATPVQCSKGSDIDPAALKLHRQYADKHLAAVAAQLKQGTGLYERQRVITTDEAGFADQLTPRMKKAQSLIAQQGYTAARNDAVLSIGGLAALSWTLHADAATWWQHKLDIPDSVRRCAGA